MGSELPKQFMLLKGEPLLFHCLRAFRSFDSSMDLVLVLPKEHHGTWKELCNEHIIQIPHEVVEGGRERYHSVKAGLDHLSGEGVVAVHDGVRPVVSAALLQRCFDAAELHGTAIPVVPIASSVRELHEDGSSAMDRTKLRIVQTPQCFKISILEQAFAMPYDPSFTDEATLVERAGVKVHLVDGEEQNLKVTTPLDMRLAEALVIGTQKPRKA